ncbi:MAG: hypothetical protein QM811_23205 [Pirellulales bacterium]
MLYPGTRSTFVIAAASLLVASALAQRPVATQFAAAEYAKPGPAKVETYSTTWHDAKRGRAVPVKLYYPRGDTVCPLIVFSHGLGGSNEGYGYLGEHWASHGFASLHLQHVGSDRGVLAKGGVKELVKATTDPNEFMNRAADVTFALDHVLELDQADPKKLDPPNKQPPFPLHKRIDTAHLGMSGHSFGANTTVTIGGVSHPLLAGEKSLADSRVKAIAPLSTPVMKTDTPERLKKLYAGIAIPSLHMTGTADDSPIGDTPAAARRLPYDHSTNAERILLTFDGGTHMLFGGRVEFRNRERDRRYQAEIQQATTIFWNAYLRDDAAARSWLLEPSGMTVAYRGDAVVETAAPKPGLK